MGTAVVAPAMSRSEVRVTMDIFQHRYYRLGTILMSLTGTWPYQRTDVRRGILAVAILFIAYQIVAQILAIGKYQDDWNMLMACFLPISFDGVCVTKYLGAMWNSQKMLKLLDHIRMDWQVWARHREVKILHEYAELAGKITIVYTATLYAVTFGFMIQPMMTMLINVALKNSTEPGRFPFPVVYYHLDEQNHYFYLTWYCTVCALILVTTLVSSGVMLIIYVQHVSGIFVAVGHQLEQIGSYDISTEPGESSYAIDKTARLCVASCIDRHNNAIEYANLIKASYTWNFFFTLVFGMILINASGLQMFRKTSDFEETLPFIVLSLATLIYCYIENFVSQILIDHSTNIRFYINNSQWYRLPPKTQKILQLIMIRCNKPCELTVGKMVTMSVQTFGMIMRTTLSYFTFMRSMQGLKT